MTTGPAAARLAQPFEVPLHGIYPVQRHFDRPGLTVGGLHLRVEASRRVSLRVDPG